MANVFNAAKKGILDATIDMDADTLEVALFTTAPASLSGALQDLATMTALLGDAAFTEASHASYTANGTTGRVVLGAVTNSQDDTNDRAESDVGDITYTALDTFTITGAVIYKRVGAAGPSGDGTHIPIAFYALSQVTNGGDIVLQIDGEGFLHLT